MSNLIDFHSKDVSSTVLENDRMEVLKLEQSKYLQQKIICDLVEDLIKSDHLDANLKLKIKDIILSENRQQTSSIASKCKNGTLFGICEQNTALSYPESRVVQEMIKLKLSESSADLAASHPSWTDLVESNRELKPIQISSEDKILLETRNKLNIEQQKYLKNLINLHELLEQMTNLRIVKVSEVINDKLRECQLQQKINHLKSTLAEQKCRVDIFTETACSLKAYKELIKDVKKQQEDCQKEIDNLTELKDSYKTVSGKQYDEILQSYLQCKATLERRKMFYNCLKN